MTIYVVVDNSAIVGAYTDETDAIAMVRACNRAAEIGGGYPKAHYEAVSLNEKEG